MPEKLKNSLLDIGDYISIGGSEYTKNFKNFVILTLLINLPIAIVGLFLPSEEQPNPENSWIILIFILLSIILGTLAALAVPKMIERSIQGQTLSATTALQNATPKLFIALVVSIITAIIVGIGFILLLIPGIWLGVLLSFTFSAIAVRNCGLNALSYSRSLVKNRWWAVFGRSLLLGLCFAVVYILLAIAVGLISAFISLSGFESISILTQLISNCCFGLINYYAATVYTVMFLNFDYTRNSPPTSVEPI